MKGIGKMLSFGTKYFDMTISETGSLLSFTDKRGKTRAHLGEPVFYLDNEKERILPSAVRLECGAIRIEFPAPYPAFIVTVTEGELALKLSLDAVGEYDFGKFVFAAIHTLDTDGGADFSITAVTHSLYSDLLELPGRCEWVGGTVNSKVGVGDAAISIIGAPRDELSSAIRNVYSDISADEVPTTVYGGAFAKDAPGVRDGYLIIYGIDRIDDEWFKPLLEMNIKQADFIQNGLFRQADYHFDEKIFPRGIIDFKERVADVLHKNGMKAGLHTYSAMVPPTCSYATPVPSDHLAALATYTLAEDISSDEESLKIVEDLGSVAMRQSPHSYLYPTCLQIDKEIIFFSAKKDGRIAELKRGFLGTAAAPHKKGAVVKHLRNMYNYFQAVPGSPLFFELAENMAKAYNEGDFDMMYFDGLECIGNTINKGKRGFYYEALFVREVLRRCKKTPLVEYSTFHPRLWAARSRMGAFDVFRSGRRQGTNIHIKSNLATCERRLLPSTLGWLDCYLSPERYEAEPWDNWMEKILYEDEVDYVGIKAIAHCSSLSYIMPDFQTFERDRKGHRFMHKNAFYSRIVSEGRVGEETKRILADPERDFLVEEYGEKILFREQKRLNLRPYSFKDGENGVRVNNPFAAQRPKIRIEAQHCADGDGETVIAFDRNVPVAEQKVRFTFDEDSRLNLSGREALRLWVKGNSSDEYINLRLKGGIPLCAYGDHFIKLDFDGWRCFDLCENDNGETGNLQFVNDDFDVSGGGYIYQRYREYYGFSDIERIDLLFSGEAKEVYVGELTAAPVCREPVKNVAISLGDESISFVGEISPGEYVEYDPVKGTAEVYNRLGFVRGIEVKGALTLPAGESELTFSAVARGTGRIKVHLLVLGELIENK